MIFIMCFICVCYEGNASAADGDGVYPELMLKAQQNPPLTYPQDTAVDQLDGQWWVLHTKARNEKSLAWDLLKRDVSYFLPMHERLRSVRGRKIKTVVVLFPGYIFLCGAEQDRYTAMTTNRVASAIDVLDQPRIVRELTAIQMALHTPRQLDPFPYLQTGRRCVVTSGPFKGVEGCLVRRKNVDRLVLQIHVLGQAVSTEIDASLLQVIE